MAQYIDKDALVAKIKRLYNRAERRVTLEKEGLKAEDTRKYEDGLADAYNIILSLIDTLKVKEVDLDEAARKWEDKVYLEKGWQNEYGTPHAPFSEIGNAFREGAKFILKVQKGELWQ